MPVGLKVLKTVAFATLVLVNSVVGKPAKLCPDQECRMLAARGLEQANHRADEEHN